MRHNTTAPALPADATDAIRRAAAEAASAYRRGRKLGSPSVRKFAAAVASLMAGNDATKAEAEDWAEWFLVSDDCKRRRQRAGVGPLFWAPCLIDADGIAHAFEAPFRFATRAEAHRAAFQHVCATNARGVRVAQFLGTAGGAPALRIGPAPEPIKFELVHSERVFAQQACRDAHAPDLAACMGPREPSLPPPAAEPAEPAERPAARVIQIAGALSALAALALAALSGGAIR